jgi:hypothetical protein
VPHYPLFLILLSYSNKNTPANRVTSSICSNSIFFPNLFLSLFFLKEKEKKTYYSLLSTFCECEPKKPETVAASNMQASNGYPIKQATARTPQNMAYMMGDVTLQVARKMLANLPEMLSRSVVHDNACGNGIISRAVMRT